MTGYAEVIHAAPDLSRARSRSASPKAKPKADFSARNDNCRGHVSNYLTKWDLLVNQKLNSGLQVGP